MKKITQVILLSFFAMHLLAGQSMPIDFSEISEVFTGFEGSSYSESSDPEDGANPVGQFFNDGSTPWQGFFLDLTSPVNFDQEKMITLSFYQFDPNAHNLIVKFENGENDDVEVAVVTSGVGWKRDLEFNFANATLSGTSNTTNASGNYSRITVFIDGGATIPGTYLIDDINDGSEPSDPNELDVIYEGLVWSDEFDTDGPINGSNWFHQTQIPEGGSWFNGEVQHYTNRVKNSYVEDGFLHIEAIKETFTNQGVTKDYTSARLNSKFAFTYGRVDVRAKLPSGEGTWPAIWTLGKNIDEAGAYWETQGFGEVGWPTCGELDIMEHGLHETNEVSVAIHTPSSFGNTVNTTKQMLPDVANNFYVYSMNWSPDEIAFMIDGNVIYRYNPNVKNENNWPFNKDQYILLNVAMGGVSGPIDPNFTQSSMVIDYVRVYQNAQLSTESFDLNAISVYPNPTKDRLNLRTDVLIDRADVYNTLGQLVWSERKVESSLDVSQIPQGVYVLNLYADGNQTSLKFVKY